MVKSFKYIGLILIFIGGCSMDSASLVIPSMVAVIGATFLLIGAKYEGYM